MPEPDATGSESTAAHAGVKRGLPLTGLPGAEEAIVKLWNAARRGVTSPEAYARQFSATAKPTGGTWSKRIAVLRGFDLIRFEGRQLGLSQLGHAIVDASKPAEQLQARRTAVLNLKAYRELVKAYDGTQLPDLKTIAQSLQFEYGKKEDVANRAATEFVKSLRHAQMLGDDDIVAAGGVSGTTGDSDEAQNGADDNLPEVESVDLDQDRLAAEDDLQAAEIDRAFDEDDGDVEDDDVETNRFGQGAGRSSAASSTVSLSVNLDLSQFRADDVVKILGFLGLGGPNPK